MFEVEQKYPLASTELLLERLAELGAEVQEPVWQSDTYYAHPARDFGQTDEALRIRRVGPVNCLTYKGPKLDAATKTRREIEIDLAPDAATAENMAELLEALGFVRFGVVRKQRRRVAVPWEGREVEGALDEVEGLGSFFELELTADRGQLEQAQKVIQSLARRLELKGSERKSYLELLYPDAKK